MGPDNQMEKVVHEDLIVEKIYLIRGQKVMLDRDLAELYGVETRVLNQAVRRNMKRFPEDFMFQLTKEEMGNWMSQFVTSNREKMGLRKLPLVFTEQGVAMLSSVLSSDRAIQVNIRIIRVFTKLRTILESHKEILFKIEQLQQKDSEHDEQIIVIFEYLKKLEQERLIEKDFRQRKRIGFTSSEE